MMVYSKKLIAASEKVCSAYRNKPRHEKFFSEHLSFKELLEKGKSIGKIQDYLQTPHPKTTPLLNFIEKGCFNLLILLNNETNGMVVRLLKTIGADFSMPFVITKAEKSYRYLLTFDISPLQQAVVIGDAEAVNFLIETGSFEPLNPIESNPTKNNDIIYPPMKLYPFDMLVFKPNYDVANAAAQVILLALQQRKITPNQMLEFVDFDPLHKFLSKVNIPSVDKKVSLAKTELQLALERLAKDFGESDAKLANKLQRCALYVSLYPEFREAIENGDVKTLRKFSDSNPLLLEMENAGRAEPLGVAINKNQRKCIDFLLEKQPNCLKKTIGNNVLSTPPLSRAGVGKFSKTNKLHILLLNGHMDLIEPLMEEYPDILDYNSVMTKTYSPLRAIVSPKEFTTLDLALAMGKFKFAAKLISAYLKENPKAKYDYTRAVEQVYGKKGPEIMEKFGHAVYALAQKEKDKKHHVWLLQFAADSCRYEPARIAIALLLSKKEEVTVKENTFTLLENFKGKNFINQPFHVVLGQLYSDKDVTHPNPEQGHECFEFAWETEQDPAGGFELAKDYELERGIGKNNIKAAQIYLETVKQNHQPSVEALLTLIQSMTGNPDEIGCAVRTLAELLRCELVKGTEDHTSSCITQLQMFAKQNFHPANYELGCYYFEKKQYELAAAEFDCGQFYPPAGIELARLHRNNLLEIEFDEAMEKSCVAYVRVLDIYAKQKLNDDGKSKAKSILEELRQMADDKGYGAAKYWYGVCLERKYEGKFSKVMGNTTVTLFQRASNMAQKYKQAALDAGYQPSKDAIQQINARPLRIIRGPEDITSAFFDEFGALAPQALTEQLQTDCNILNCSADEFANFALENKAYKSGYALAARLALLEAALTLKPSSALAKILNEAKDYLESKFDPASTPSGNLAYDFISAGKS